jgi:hypothetical protein|tara:strand:- start:16 stop:189 length:174 start_codon:yes stop_codon:yes gene_type:complete
MAKKVRARTDEGKFIADDPDTPQNEAWKVVEKSSSTTLPPKGSAEYKAMLLRGEIKE